VVSFDLHVHQPEGFRALLESSGWTNVQFYGGYDLEPFDRWSPDLLVVARRSSTGAHR
jgi:hypothetical protein